MSDLTCPHCHNNVPNGASVCRGCQAEVEYGAPGKWYIWLFIVCIISGGMLSSKLPSSIKEFGVGSWLVTFPLGAWLIFKSSKDRVIFKRPYRTR
jgi:hypothetical protein